jgi:hypothetical protein
MFRIALRSALAADSQTTWAMVVDVAGILFLGGSWRGGVRQVNGNLILTTRRRAAMLSGQVLRPGVIAKMQRHRAEFCNLPLGHFQLLE